MEIAGIKLPSWGFFAVKPFTVASKLLHLSSVTKPEVE
jgi:hypothetical protein